MYCYLRPLARIWCRILFHMRLKNPNSKIIIFYFLCYKTTFCSKSKLIIQYLVVKSHLAFLTKKKEIFVQLSHCLLFAFLSEAAMGKIIDAIRTSIVSDGVYFIISISNGLYLTILSIFFHILHFLFYRNDLLGMTSYFNYFPEAPSISPLFLFATGFLIQYGVLWLLLTNVLFLLDRTSLS